MAFGALLCCYSDPEFFIYFLGCHLLFWIMPFYCMVAPGKRISLHFSTF